MGTEGRGEGHRHLWGHLSVTDPNGGVSVSPSLSPMGRGDISVSSLSPMAAMGTPQCHCHLWGHLCVITVPMSPSLTPMGSPQCHCHLWGHLCVIIVTYRDTSVSSLSPCHHHCHQWGHLCVIIVAYGPWGHLTVIVPNGGISVSPPLSPMGRGDISVSSLSPHHHH